ncbi:FecR domain-containing protein [Undibacterium sp. CY18W]|uniref:FecR domain-containing protein n=1 Tax=Undibacterium hunanense TaxID=2762292 RepID=A0ABR6ZXN0_9BURK|nr:FecR domain-containing protein [Undibacterium hunanense]MBC3920544.1 FecR domain-containing protein [Undibacterium hunanense]
MSLSKHLEYAMLLIVRQHGGDPEVAQQALETSQQWRTQASDHETAYQTALKAWKLSDAGELKGQLPIPSVNQSRRRVTIALAVVGAAVLVGGGQWWFQQPLQEFALSTKTGERSSQRLSDGSMIDLAARSKGQVSYYRSRREVRLVEGEMRFAVARDTERPFFVVTDLGRVRVLGTVFTVAVRDKHMTVEVAEGKVAVWSSHESGLPVDMDKRPATAELSRGKTIQIDATGTGLTGSVEPDDVGAWRQGWLVFENTSLEQVLSRWNDYLHEPLVLGDDPVLRQMRVTGSFQSNKPMDFFNSLPKILPVHLSARGDGATVINARLPHGK